MRKIKYSNARELCFTQRFQTMRLLTGTYSSIRPPANTPCSLGPNFLSDSNAKITDSVMMWWAPHSPCDCPYSRSNTSRGLLSLRLLTCLANLTWYNQLLRPPLKQSNETHFIEYCFRKQHKTNW